MTIKHDDERECQSGDQSDGQPEWKQRLQRLCGSGSFWVLLGPSGSMCFVPSGWRGMQTVGRGATMRPGCVVLIVQLNLLNTRLGVDMYSMEWLEYYMGCDVSF